ncbi:MAG: PmoA family protein, partial [Candidatus Nealsonbacteria bacterium]|nr:PmoA family protein [Candidatus Nealsonbacteria bacterium]
MHRKFRAETLHAAMVLTAAFLGLAEACCVAADKAPEKIVGKSLTILRDADRVTVEQGDRILVRYRYAKNLAGPRITEINSPDGVNVPGDLMFAWTIDGVDFGGGAGTQLHERWLELRIDRRGDREQAVLVEQLVWETPDGDVILEEQRTLTVPAVDAGRPQILLWQSNVTPGEDAVDVLTIGGSKSGGFGVRFGPEISAAPQYFNASGQAVAANGRAPWAACTTATDNGKVTVAVFDAPGNPQHPTGWAANGEKSPASLVATSSLESQPLRLEPGKTLSVRFGVAALDGTVKPRQVDAAYLDWYRLQTAARSGLVPGLLAQYSPAAASNAPACARIDRSIAFDWAGGMPDDRLPTGPFSVVWTGQVRIDRDGEYRLFGRYDGQMQIRVGDKRADGESIRLEYGYHPIRVQYVADSTDASAKLYWESDHFAPEPVNPRYLVHDASLEADLAMDLLHDAGSAVVVQYGCARCHATIGVDAKRRPGRPLAFASQAHPDYL